jgi:hypothetical protein
MQFDLSRMHIRTFMPTYVYTCLVILPGSTWPNMLLDTIINVAENSKFTRHCQPCLHSVVALSVNFLIRAWLVVKWLKVIFFQTNHSPRSDNHSVRQLRKDEGRRKESSSVTKNASSCSLKIKLYWWWGSRAVNGIFPFHSSLCYASPGLNPICNANRTVWLHQTDAHAKNTRHARRCMKSRRRVGLQECKHECKCMQCAKQWLYHNIGEAANGKFTSRRSQRSVGHTTNFTNDSE